MTPKRRGQAPRQSDVARLAGVSQSAVSRVISGDVDAARIPEETRQRVLAAIKELGYVPNASARNLRNKRNQLIGVHTFEAVFPHARDDFYFEFLLGIEERAEETGFDLVLFTSTGAGDGRRRVYRDGTNRLNLADGSVLLGVATDRAELARLWADGYPFVHIGRREVPGAEIPCVIPDYRGAAIGIVDKLAGHGHRRFAYLREPMELEPYADRRDGYREAVRRLGLIDRSPGFRGESGLTDDWIDEIVRGGETAVVAESVRMAEHLLGGLTARGVRVPEDISVAVLEATGWWDSLEIPRIAIGRIAVDRVIDMLDDPDRSPGSLLVPCPIVPGKTIAAAQERRP
ncbi:LacI family DNA-binding transcriptional regulator [Nonomuraea sp. NPDC049714]|uniref:LacI family DNA-binding transcriptional regulator n=1 Tax=Nonomuraea sp. NPDC049714 TaxID=3364357 RepID=UPI00379B3B87